MPSDLEITSFTDAIAVAFGVRRHFTFGHGVALVDGGGRVLELRGFADRSHSIETVLTWAERVVPKLDGCERIVLLSAVTSGVADVLREDDVARLRAARRRFAGLGVLVVDWLQCDGDVVRSIDLASDGEGWRLASSARDTP